MPLLVPSIDEDVLDFARTISPDGPVETVTLSPVDGARAAQCNENVTYMVGLYRGEAVSGWAIWSDSDQYLMAEAHVIWRTPERELVDVTPRGGDHRTILFLHHAYRWPALGFMPESRYRALTDDPMVRAIIAHHRAYYHLRIDNNRDPNQLELASLKTEIVRMMQGTYTKEACLCRSGLPFQACCGRPETEPDPYVYAPL